MAIQHNVITDPNIHEPKGATSAVSETAYVANGAGSGVWKRPLPSGSDSAGASKVLEADGA